MLNINIHSKNVGVTEGITAAINEKLRKIEKFLQPNTVIQVSLETNKHGQKIQITTYINDKCVKAESVEDNLYNAIDIAADKLKAQIEKYQQKLDSYSLESIRHDENEDETKSVQKIVKVKTLDYKPMSEAEAVLQMEMLGHNSFMFFNTDEECYSMLYRRHDGDYGLILTSN